jgi:hypothetical protein
MGNYTLHERVESTYRRSRARNKKCLLCGLVRRCVPFYHRSNEWVDADQDTKENNLWVCIKCNKYGSEFARDLHPYNFKEELTVWADI